MRAWRMRIISATTPRRRRKKCSRRSRASSIATSANSLYEWRPARLFLGFADDKGQNARAGHHPIEEIKHETIRPHRKAARHQARERLELEIYLRKDRWQFRGADRRCLSWPDEADQAAGCERRRAVRTFKVRDRDAQRGADARFADAADRSLDLPVLRTRDGQRPGLEGLDRGRVR